MTFPFLLSFKKNLEIKSDANDCLIIDPAGVTVRTKSPSTGTRMLLKLLLGPGGTKEALCDTVAAADGSQSYAGTFYFLQQLDQKGFFCRTVILDNVLLATLIPMSQPFGFADTPVDPAHKFTLSRFAFCRNDNGRMILECPLGHGKLALGGQGMQMIASLATPVSISDICKFHGIADERSIQAFFSLLMNIKALEVTGKAPEGPRETALSQWDFHDLLFHTRSRAGRTDHPFGATFRFMGKIDPLPAVKPPIAKEHLALFRPDLETLKREDPSFTQVLERRRSVRDCSQIPLTCDQVGEFLYRSCRVKGTRDADPARGAYYQRTHRPWPSGGAMHGLEIYAVVNECEGIAPGLYHYDPLAHELETLSGSCELTEKLLDQACMASNLQYEPGVLFVMTARFQRTAWKYESMAYAVMLKDLGALYQTFYLVATAMNLSPCAIGAGDSDLFAQAAGLEYYAETSIGEFLLGGGMD